MCRKNGRSLKEKSRPESHIILFRTVIVPPAVTGSETCVMKRKHELIQTAEIRLHVTGTHSQPSL